MYIYIYIYICLWHGKNTYIYIYIYIYIYTIFIRMQPISLKKIYQSIHLYITTNLCMVEGSLEVKLPTIWTNEKQRWEESERREE